MSDDENSETPPPTIAATRTRREKKDKHGRFAALQKFKVSIILFIYTTTILYVQEVVTHFIYRKLLYTMGHYFLDTQ